MNEEKSILYSHALNEHPAPPITIEVEGGQILWITIEEEAAKTYTYRDIRALFEAAGLDIEGISIPIPREFMRTPADALFFSLVPGTYCVRQGEDFLELPEAAFTYTVQRQLKLFSTPIIFKPPY